MAYYSPACSPEDWAIIRERAGLLRDLYTPGCRLPWGASGLCYALKHGPGRGDSDFGHPVNATYYLFDSLFPEVCSLGSYIGGEDHRGSFTPLRLEVLETLILWIDAGIAQELYEQIRTGA